MRKRFLFSKKECFYPSKNDHLGDSEEFHKVLEQLRTVTVKTPKHRIRGHDIFELLAWYISKNCGQRGVKYRDPEVVRSSIVMAGKPESLVGEEPFKSLLSVYK